MIFFEYFEHIILIVHILQTILKYSLLQEMVVVEEKGILVGQKVDNLISTPRELFEDLIRCAPLLQKVLKIDVYIKG